MIVCTCKVLFKCVSVFCLQSTTGVTLFTKYDTGDAIVQGMTWVTLFTRYDTGDAVLQSMAWVMFS